ncbi:MAG: mismatch-specific DNA-glycosylase [Chloroflexi bacterium]|nr:mismatch-specific DNA-glycosylase [Chloroflexota bacterium]
MNTLPDYLKEGLDIVLVGLNPSLRSVEVGHYFATPRNRFWRAINRSGLLAEPLDTYTDYKILEHGIGLTDIVKRPTRGASDLRAADYREWAPVLKEKLERFQPLIVCFHGVVAYRNYLRHAENIRQSAIELGLQPHTIGRSRVFVVPNPSPANAAYSLDTLVCWYNALHGLRDDITARCL